MRISLARLILFLTVIVLLVVFPYFTPSQFFIYLLTQVLILAIFATGLNLASGYAGLPSLGHAALFAAGAYTTAILALYVSKNIWLGIAAGVLLATLLTTIFAIISLRTSGVYFLFITLGLGQVFWALVFGWRSVTRGDDGISGIGSPQLWSSISINGNINNYYLVLFFFILTYCLMYQIIRSPFGHSIVGIRENGPRMKSLGYNVWLHRFVAFLLSGVFSGFAGVLWAYFNGYVSPHDASLGRSAEALLMVILGGSGTLFGPVLGVITVVFIKEVVSAYTERWFLILGIVYIVTILFAPQGIITLLRIKFGRRTAKIYETSANRKNF